MATNPIIQTTGSIAGAGQAGIAREDFAIGEVVDFTDTVVENISEPHKWTLTQAPETSALTVLVDDDTELAQLTLDAAGTYVVVCTVAGVYHGQIVIAVLTANYALRIPAFDEGIGDYNAGNNLKSWHPALSKVIREVDANMGGGGGAGGLVYVDTIEVTGSPAAFVTFGAGGDGDENAALDGDVDETYILEYFWPKPDTTTLNLEIHPNGTDVGGSSSFDRHISSGTVDNGSGWVICRIGTAGAGSAVVAEGDVTIKAATGKERLLFGRYSATAVGGTALIGAQMYAAWHEAVTNITSLKLICELQDLPVGTRFVLWKKVRA